MPREGEEAVGRDGENRYLATVMKMLVATDGSFESAASDLLHF